MKGAILFLTIFSGCAAPKVEDDYIRRVEQKTNYNLKILYAETDRAQLKCDKLSAELLNFREKTIAAIYQLSKGANFLYKRLEELDAHAVANEAGFWQVKKDLRDVCAILSKRYKMKKDDICYVEKSKQDGRKIKRQGKP